MILHVMLKNQWSCLYKIRLQWTTKIICISWKSWPAFHFWSSWFGYSIESSKLVTDWVIIVQDYRRGIAKKLEISKTKLIGCYTISFQGIMIFNVIVAKYLSFMISRNFFLQACGRSSKEVGKLFRKSPRGWHHFRQYCQLQWALWRRLHGRQRVPESPKRVGFRFWRNPAKDGISQCGKN